jgi:hypothetical protein
MREPRPEPVSPVLTETLLRGLITPDTQEVTVTGFAPLHDGDRAQAREEAIADALRRAVKNRTRVYVTAETCRKHERRLVEEVYAKAEEFIVRYKVLEEGTEGDLYWVRLRARVSLFLLRERLGVLGLLDPFRDILRLVDP